MAELRIEGVTRRFGDMAAVDNVSLTVADKEFLVLLGPSGCGKTTLLRSIAGLEEIQEGSISIGGVDVTSKSPKQRNIAMVFQSYAVFPHMTVGKNIAFGLERQKRPKAEIKERVQSSAELLHIEDLLDRSPNNLSGGQRQRVAVARAIAYNTDVLLMDEPLSNLDALLRMEMRAELKRLVRDIGATVIYVTHDQTEALSMGDRVAVMRNGQIRQLDKPIEIYDNPAEAFIAGFIGSPPMNLIEVEVEVVSGGDAVEIPGVGKLPHAPANGKDGDRILLGIRPENIETSDSALSSALPGRVLVSEPLGSHNLLSVQLGKAVVKVSTTPDVVFEPNQDIWLDPNPAKLRWLPVES